MAFVIRSRHTRSPAQSQNPPKVKILFKLDNYGGSAPKPCNTIMLMYAMTAMHRYLHLVGFEYGLKLRSQNSCFMSTGLLILYCGFQF